MPRVTTIKTNFTAGELSPRLLARVDVARYNNGAKTLLNAYPLVHGGARSRSGTRYKAAAKNATKQTRLVPFVFSREQAFHIELGELYARFYTGAGQIESSPGVPYEITTPWDDTDLDLLKYVQRADTMFLAHPDFAMRKLVRYANDSWVLSEVDWDVPPSEEIGERPTTALTLSAATVGAGRTFTAAADAFRASDVGRYIESGAGRGEITGFTSTTVVTVTISNAFSGTNIASGDWKIIESPKTTCTPSATGPVGGSVDLTASASAWKNFAQNTHIGSYVEINDGLVEITGFTSDTVVSGIVRTELASTTAAPSEAWFLKQVQWNSVDGYPRAVGLYQQRLIAGGTTNFPNVVWGTKVGEYLNFAIGVEDSDGFAFPLDSDQLDEIEHIATGKVLFALTAGAEWSMYGGIEKPITPTNVQANPDTAYGCDITRPVRVANEIIFTEEGGQKLRAIGFRVDNEQFNAPDISILSEHILGEAAALEMAYAKSPDSLIWIVLDDGSMATCSIDRDQDAIGFARHETEGQFESVSVIPYNGASQVAVVVVREIDGSTVRYIEFFEDGLETDSAITGEVTENAVTGASWSAGVLTVTRAGHGYSTGDTIRLSDFESDNDTINGEHDITVTGANTYTVEIDDPGTISTLGTDAEAAATWSGLDHLEGVTVDIVADGYVATQKTVSAGAITLDRAAYSVEFGIHYESTIETLPPELGTGTGTAQGNAISIHEIIVRFHKSKGGKVNGQPVLSRKMVGAVLNQPVPEFTGDKRVENLGWGRTGSGDSPGTVTILRDQPLKMQVLGVITRLTVNDG